MTFLNVLVQLINKRVQVLPLLGGKLQCIAGVDPLTQGTMTSTKTGEWDPSWDRETGSPGDRQVLTWCRCLARLFPPAQKESGNPQGETTATQRHHQRFVLKPPSNFTAGIGSCSHFELNKRRLNQLDGKHFNPLNEVKLMLNLISNPDRFDNECVFFFYNKTQIPQNARKILLKSNALLIKSK